MTPPAPPEARLVVHAPADLLARASPLACGAGEVHAWAFELAAAPDAMARCVEILSEDERAKGDRFVREALRERFRIAHGVLRHLLARYTGVEPGRLAFGAGPEGKPHLEGEARGRVAFNLSHSEARAVVVVAAAGDVGCDVERERRTDDLAGLVQGYFTREESRRILEAPAGASSREFFRHWVAKEAVLKAQGGGLSLPLDGFRVDFEAIGDGARVVPFGNAPIRAGWHVRMRSLGEGWPVAVCAAGRDWSLVAPA